MSRLMLVCVTEDQVDGRRARAEAAADGSRCGHEEQRLSLHRPVLRSSFQRGLSVLSAEHLMFSSESLSNTKHCFLGGLLDMHGAHVYLLRQILQIRLFLFRRSDSRRDFRENNISCELFFYSDLLISDVLVDIH